MIEEKPENVQVPQRISGARGIAPVTSFFAPRSELTYRLIEDVELTTRSLHRSLMTGTILRNCSFTNVDFSRCDLDGMRIEGCSFVKCELEGADIRSTVLADCSFIDSRLEGILLTDCSLANCSFHSSTLRQAVITNCTFTKCTFSECPLTRASCTLNKFEVTDFKDMTLGDCTFLYMVMKGCHFDNISINAESVGLIYGLSYPAISSIKFVYLGEEQEAPQESELIRVLLDSYASRRWAIGVAVTRLNFRLTSVAGALHDYLGGFLLDISEGRTIKVEELQFLINLLQELKYGDKLPFLSLVQLIESFSALLAKLEGKDRSENSRSIKEVRTFISELSMITQEMIDSFESSRLQLRPEYKDETTLLRAEFTHQPDISLSDLLNEIASVSGLAIIHESQTLETRKGSFIEIVSTTLFTALGFQMLIFLINGCIIQITELKARLQVLSRKRLPESYVRDALRPRQTVPAHLAKPFRQLLNHFSKVSWLVDPNLKGFSTDNLKEITIERKVDSI